MTVSSTSSRVVLPGNGATTTWPFAFKVQQPADLVVVYTDATGSDITLSTGQYDATGFGQDAGGTVTYPRSGSGNPAIASGTTLTIYRRVAVTQPTSISNQGAMWPQVIEAALDRLTFVAQAVTDAISRSLVISPTDGGSLGALPGRTLRANAYLAFDGNGQPYAATGVSGTTPVSTFWAPLLQLTTAALSRAGLGAAGTGDNNAFSGTNTFATQAAADNSTRAATTAYADRAASTAAATATGAYVIRSYLAGLGLANNVATPNTKVDVAAGACADDGNAAMLTLVAGTIDCTATGANGLDTGALAASTWYHAFAIAKADGTTARLASTGLSPALPTGYTLKRRIGSFRTDGSAHILGFVQDGDYFRWKASVLDVHDTNPGTSAVLKTLTVPSGLAVTALVNAMPTFASNAATMQISDPSANDEAPSRTAAPLGAGSSTSSTGGQTPGVQLQVRTDTSARIRYRLDVSGGSDTVYIATLGWLDRRGRDS